MVSQEVRTFFVTAATCGRRPIFHADALTRLLLEVMRHYRSASRALDVYPAPPGLEAQV